MNIHDWTNSRFPVKPITRQIPKKSVRDKIVALRESINLTNNDLGAFAYKEATAITIMTARITFSGKAKKYVGNDPITSTYISLKS